MFSTHRLYHILYILCLSLALGFAAACQTGPQTSEDGSQIEEAAGEDSGESGSDEKAQALKSRQVVIPAGTVIAGVLGETLSTKTTRQGETFQLRVSSPLVIDGQTAVPADSIIVGRVAGVKRSGRVKGRAAMSLAFNTLETPAGSFKIVAEPIGRRAPGTKKKDAAIIGGGAGIGAAVGAIAGGKKGAAVGAAAGGGAGTGAVLATRGKPAVFNSGERLNVKLVEPVKVALP